MKSHTNSLMTNALMPTPTPGLSALDAVVSTGQLLVEPHSHIASTPFSLRVPNWREESEADFTGSY